MSTWRWARQTGNTAQSTKSPGIEQANALQLLQQSSGKFAAPWQDVRGDTGYIVSSRARACSPAASGNEARGHTVAVEITRRIKER